ncbi:LacI family DNA-binding transcriptional regulator [Halobacillus sp. Marseille-Q1614]|uniref:LacI family DNA-binding transcriptional regulator n=1 Tax=Halobacillus sp. Marseille-Q1614 TaxID=2709134 RepID=UPI00156DE99E|nr:LacI family DNA-binding transcriptional regulator [Halobacillus sp. Marseille-Q1614]
MATIKDVAKKAGVSVSVVSKAFNNYADINPMTRERILKIAMELNYTPNLAARNLSSKKQTNVGLISSAVLNHNEKDTNAYEVIKGIYTAVEERGYDLSIFLIDSQKQKQKSYTQFCRERNIGGAILQGMRTDDAYFRELVDTKIPCVCVDMMTEDKTNPYIGGVSLNNRAAAKEAAVHLLENNHREIVIVAGTKETTVNIERLKGVEDALEENSILLKDLDILYADFSEEKAYQLAKEYLQAKRPTAFLCFSDLMVFGVMKAVKEAGLRIPEDLSITGFDNLPFSSLTYPPLTSVQQDFFEIGKQSAQLLLDLMEGKLDRHHIFVNHKLVKRESVRKI